MRLRLGIPVCHGGDKSRFGDRRIYAIALCVAVCAVTSGPAMAGPPYVSDDPEPTDYRHYEIYGFSDGSAGGRGGAGGEAGIDFNYGAAPDLQLTAVGPVAYQIPPQASAAAGVGNIELAAKYRFLHQSDIGWDVAVFPRVFLPSASATVGAQHAALFLPFWLEKDWGDWSTFGGGGCEFNRGGGSKDFCQAGWVLARQVLPDLQLGAEIVHQTADTEGGRSSTAIGLGLRYDFSDNFHLLGYVAPGLQDAAQTARWSWYASVLFTF
jgi:hypothetical protein